MRVWFNTIDNMQVVKTTLFSGFFTVSASENVCLHVLWWFLPQWGPTGIPYITWGGSGYSTSPLQVPEMRTVLSLLQIGFWGQDLVWKPHAIYHYIMSYSGPSFLCEMALHIPGFIACSSISDPNPSWCSHIDSSQTECHSCHVHHEHQCECSHQESCMHWHSCFHAYPSSARGFTAHHSTMHDQWCSTVSRWRGRLEESGKWRRAKSRGLEMRVDAKSTEQGQGEHPSPPPCIVTLTVQLGGRCWQGLWPQFYHAWYPTACQFHPHFASKSQSQPWLHDHTS